MYARFFCKQGRCWRVVILAKHRPEKGATYLQNNSVNVFAALVSKGLCLNKKQTNMYSYLFKNFKSFQLRERYLFFYFTYFNSQAFKIRFYARFIAAGSYVLDFKLTMSLQCGLFGA